MAESKLLSLETDELSVPYQSLPLPSLVTFPPSREEVFNSSNQVVPSPAQRSTAYPIAVAGSNHLPGRPLQARYRNPEFRAEPKELVHCGVPEGSGLYPQSGHYRSLSDSSSDGHTPEQEASPEGSPKEKYEELVLTGATFNKDKKRFRDRQRPAPSRLETFRNWPSLYPAERLAAAGFKYQGIRDQVFCTGCGRTLEDWNPSDDPYEEHKKHYGHECFKPY